MMIFFLLPVKMTPARARGGYCCSGNIRSDYSTPPPTPGPLKYSSPPCVVENPSHLELNPDLKQIIVSWSLVKGVWQECAGLWRRPVRLLSSNIHPFVFFSQIHPDTMKVFCENDILQHDATERLLHFQRPASVWWESGVAGMDAPAAKPDCKLPLTLWLLESL